MIEAGAGICAGAASMTLTSDFWPAVGVHHLAEQLGGKIEINAARTARNRGADRARQADADVGGMQHAERRLAQRLGDGELVHLLVVALLQVDDFALGRARDQDHRKTIGGGVSQRREAVEEAGRRHRQADAGLLGQEAGDRGGVAGILFVTEGQDADAGGLCHAAEIRDRNARHAVDRGQAVELERVDNEVEAVGQLLLCFGLLCFTAASAMAILRQCLARTFSPDNRRNAPHDRRGRAHGRAQAPLRGRSSALPEPR